MKRRLKTFFSSMVGRASLASALLCFLVCVVCSVFLFAAQKNLVEQQLLLESERSISKHTSYLLGYFYNQQNWVHLRLQQKYLSSSSIMQPVWNLFKRGVPRFF